MKFCKRRDPDGLTEVGLPHSSEETGESQRSKGGSKESFPEEEAFRHKRSEGMEQELKGIREQSAKYQAVQNLMHNVNERTLMAEHRKQSKKESNRDRRSRQGGLRRKS